MAKASTRFVGDKFTGEYWVLVESNRKDPLSNWEPVPPIDLGFGMLVFSSLENATFASKEQYRLYGITCRPQLLTPLTV